MPQKNTKPIIILGMHRSGTSCLAGALQQAGLFLGEVSEHNKFNLKGNRENNSIMSLNEKILQYSGGSWNHIPKKIKWLKSHEEQAFKIIDDYTSLCESFWGFKDPRTVLTYPFWKRILPNAQIIGTFRHPLKVVESLKNRSSNFSESHALDLWSAYNRRILHIYHENHFPLISFDATNYNYLKALQMIIKEVGLPNDVQPDFFDSKLRTHTTINTHIQLPEEIIDHYKKLNSYSKS